LSPEDSMSSQTDRRAPDATRIPFDAMVEVGGAQGPSFEAQALNVSTTGIALRAGYLPAVGQPLTCQFETESGESVLAAGEVTWCQDGPDGGEFGLSFGQLDAQSLATLAKLLPVADATDPADGSAPAPRVPVGRVRLHIDGLGAPMRARVRDASTAKVTTTSELGYLTAGKLLELEDAETGDKRPARIQRVEVETNDAHVPQLVVTMKYQDAGADAADGDLSEPMAAPRRRTAEADDDGDGHEMKHEFGERAKGVATSMGAGLKKLGPALGAVLLRAKTAAGMLAQKRKAVSEEAPARRTTAPAPSGALHSSGRKVVRSERERDDEPEAPTPPKLDKRKLGVAGAVGVALILGLVAMRKPHEPAPLAAAPPEPVASVAAVAPAPEPPAPPPAAAPAAPAAPAIVAAAAQPSSADTSPAFGADEEEASPPGKKGKPKPFSNGPVAHGTVLKLKMDGPIERLQGAPQPTGFTVVLPNRRSLEAASPLAAKDSRIAGIRIANDGGGAELTVTFKDGVPNYLVRAKGDTLEMVLSKEKASTADAKPAKKGHKPAGRGKGRKGHGKH
jgi:hypothetical protein